MISYIQDGAVEANPRQHFSLLTGPKLMFMRQTEGIFIIQRAVCNL